MRRALGFTSMLIVGLAACNAILGNESSIEYVDGDAFAPDRRNADDAAADGRDASVDASEPDAAPDPAVSCDAAAFCADFDPPSTTIPFGWRKAQPDDASVFPLDQTDFVTPPNALALTSAVGEPGKRWLATKDIDGGRPFDFVFDLFLRAAGTGSIQLLQIACRPSQTFRVFIDQNRELSIWSLQQQVAGPVVPAGQWVRLAVAITDQQTILYVLEPQQALATLTGSCLGPYTVSLGIVDTLQSADAGDVPWTILFDRVRATVP